MRKVGLAAIAVFALAGCGDGGEGAGGLTADEEQRLENIAARLDEEAFDLNLVLDNAQEAEVNSVQP